MWNRIILKEKGKIAFRRNYWKCVIVALIALVILGSNFTYRVNSSSVQTNPSQTQIQQEFHQVITTRHTGFALGSGAAFSLLHIFVFSVLEIGCDKFFIRNASSETDLDQVLDGFRTNYGRNVVTMFLTRLFIVLWSLLLVIPGIVKRYSYMLVPYILADNPDISRRDAMALSERLMYGNKMDAFMLDLSFIGWHILNAFTVGILGVIYVNPYVQATKAELYLALRDSGIEE